MLDLFRSSHNQVTPMFVLAAQRLLVEVNNIYVDHVRICADFTRPNFTGHLNTLQISLVKYHKDYDSIQI